MKGFKGAGEKPHGEWVLIFIMKIYDDMFTWEGFGGKLRLASGKCQLKIYDLNKGEDRRLVHLKPVVVVATD